MRKAFLAVILLAVIVSFGVSEAVQTNVIIRAKSKDAKFIGTKMGGAMVVVRDSETGKVLAEGLTAGSTGDTGKIMMEPKTIATMPPRPSAPKLGTNASAVIRIRPTTMSARPA